MKIKKPKKITYINDDETMGISYDWNLVQRAYSSLNCSDEYYDPSKLPLDECAWFVIMSDRSSGKTTNILLLSICAYWLYGTTTTYVRNGEEEIAPKASKNLFSVITDFNYIEKITDGKYNSVCYKSRRWYLCSIDETGAIVERDEQHFMFMADVMHAENLKSVYNAPRGDIIIFDEFISERYQCQFIQFCDLLKTIIREKRSSKIFMLSNNIDRYSLYFRELCIYDTVMQLRQGNSEIVRTKKGTQLYVEMIGLQGERKRKRKIVNEIYFGFNNPKLSSITGDADWRIDNYPHIPELPYRVRHETVINNIFVEYGNKLCNLEVVLNPELGICVYVHWATQTYEDSIILTIEDIYDPRQIYGLGTGNLKKLLADLYKQNKYYYATNDVGAFFSSYLREIKTKSI